MTTSSTAPGRYADVNGVHLYFETHGSGRPLVLLHGGLASGEMFTPLLPAFAADRRVVLVDLQGHGRTADVDRPLDVRSMADDVAALLDHLGLDAADVAGYSLGGKVALQLAIRHPGKVTRLITTSVPVRRDASYPEVLAQQEQLGASAVEFLKDSPAYQRYQQVAPHPEDFPRLLDKIGAAITEDFDYTEDVRRLTAPTLVVAADADMAPPGHFVEVFALLGGGRRDGGWDGRGRPGGGHALAILPGLTHYDITTSPLFTATVLAFLDRR